MQLIHLEDDDIRAQVVQVMVMAQVVVEQSFLGLGGFSADIEQALEP